MSTGRRFRLGRHRRAAGPRDAYQDAYQVLQASLAATLADTKQPRVMVTSPGGSEGKTVTAVNLALCCAQAGQRVVLVDLDFRHPDAHRLLGASNDVGIGDALLETQALEPCLQLIELPGSAGSLRFLATGPLAGNPAELLSRHRLPEVLDLLSQDADVVLIDTPPLMPVADALVVGRLVTGALVVVQAHRSTFPELTRAQELLARNHITLYGVVLNQVDPRERGYWELPTPPAAAAGPLG